MNITPLTLMLHTIQPRIISYRTLLVTITILNSFNTSIITNNITRHNHNNYEHNVIKQVHRHIKHIHTYGTDINCYSKKSLNRNNVITSIMIIFISERLKTYH